MVPGNLCIIIAKGEELHENRFSTYFSVLAKFFICGRLGILSMVFDIPRLDGAGGIVNCTSFFQVRHSNLGGFLCG